jgi:co-chaperonin GroES (HSP10)
MVVNICDGLDSKKMNWITENELQRGDIAVYSFESAMHCWFDDESRSLIDEFKDIYFILDYEDIFCVKRGKELIPINGYVLCEPISEFTGKTKLHIPDEVRNKKSEKFGRVKYVGARNKGYQLLTDRGPKLRPELHDAPIKEGDVILFDKYCDLPIEHAMHSGITGQGQVLYRMHQCYIKAVMS